MNNFYHTAFSFHYYLKVGILRDEHIVDEVSAHVRLVGINVLRGDVAVSTGKRNVLGKLRHISARFAYRLFKVEVLTRIGDVIARFYLYFDFKLFGNAVKVELRTERRFKICVLLLGDGDVVFSLLLYERTRVGERLVLAGDTRELKFKGIGAGGCDSTARMRTV